MEKNNLAELCQQSTILERSLIKGEEIDIPKEDVLEWLVEICVIEENGIVN